MARRLRSGGQASNRVGSRPGVWLMMSKRCSAVSMAVVVSAALPACALDDTAGDESPPGSLAEASQPLATSLPQCDPQSPGYTPGVYVQAIPRSGQAGYWRSFPNFGVPFSPLAGDHASEESLDLADSTVPPVWSDSYPCVTVLDASGVFLDF